MIGVICKNRQQEVVKEFFQLFKVPYEIFQEGRHYEVIIATDDAKIVAYTPKLLIISNPEPTFFDSKYKLSLGTRKTAALLESNGFHVPIYGEIASITTAGIRLLEANREGIVGGVKIEDRDQKIVRIGYDIFNEIEYLLRIGQGIENAQIPTLEIHIFLLRDWILDVGVPIVEIPPTPHGYDFTACLTHDIDFIGIRDHKFDHTFFGFLYRSLSLSQDQEEKSWRKYGKLESLDIPLGISCLIPDFWYP
jgi:hypothetical protein